MLFFISRLIKTSLFSSRDERSVAIGVIFPALVTVARFETVIVPVALLFKFLTDKLRPSTLVISALKDAVWEEKSLFDWTLLSVVAGVVFWRGLNCIPAKNPIDKPRMNKKPARIYKGYFEDIFHF